MKRSVACPDDCSLRCARNGRKVLASCHVAALRINHSNNELGRYLTAKKSFEIGDYVMEYVGDHLTKDEAQSKQDQDALQGKLSSYQVTVADFVVDGMDCGNLGAFVNYSHKPNMVFRSLVVDGVWRIFFVATRKISLNDVLSANYGEDYRDNAGRWVRCCCGESTCSGLISFKRQQIGKLFRDSPEDFPRCGGNVWQVVQEMSRRNEAKATRIKQLEQELSKAQEKREKSDGHIDHGKVVITNQCPVCGERFSCKQFRDQHIIRRHEPEESSRRHTCSACDYCGKTAHDLSRHRKRRHTQAKQYKCKICRKRFGVKQDRDRHRNVHSDERDFACSVCGKRYKYSSSRNRHQEQHLL